MASDLSEIVPRPYVVNDVADYRPVRYLIQIPKQGYVNREQVTVSRGFDLESQMPFLPFEAM